MMPLASLMDGAIERQPPLDGPRAVRVVVAEPHASVRIGLREVFADSPIRIIAEARGPHEILASLRDVRPDVLLLEIGGGPGNEDTPHGLAVLTDVKRHFPEISVVIYSMRDEDRYIAACLELGAVGYVVKGASVSELAAAIQSAAVLSARSGGHGPS